MGIFNLENIKKSSVYITPNFPAIQTRRFKFSLQQVLYVIFGYTFLVMLIVITILALTPAKEIIFILENEELIKQAGRIEELEKKVLFLRTNLEALASTNEKMRYALILGGIDTLESIQTPPDTQITEKPEPPLAGGNILQAVRKLFSSDQEKNELDLNNFFISPVNGFVINEFNPEKGHLGLDYAVREGTPVFAAAGGLVLFADYTTDNGNMCILFHDNDLISIYKHCSALLIRERDYAVQGEVIALSGNTGYNSTGAHLHFEIWKKGKAIDPANFLIN
ncbi:M23 family metallopeptidase [Bacteroidota bacterium]